MSLDLYMYSPKCETCGLNDSTDNFNYTYNCGVMWREIYPDEKMVQIDGMTGKEALQKLKHALDEMQKKPDKFKALNPSNKWGNCIAFMGYLENLIDNCEERPDWIWGARR